jgi:hypothetical protein
MISSIILENFFKKIKMMFLFCLLFSCNISAQITDSANYYPLNAGDRYYYYGNNYCPPYSSTLGNIYNLCCSKRILDSVIINKFKYYVTYVKFGTQMDSARIDSNRNVIILRGSKEQIFYKLNANIGDSWNFIDTIGGDERNYKITLQSKTDTILVHAGKFINCYRFYFSLGLFTWFMDGLAPDVGLLYRCIEESFVLKNAIIKGKEYPLTLVPEEKNPISIFELYQNYPNPFNPTTNIDYQVPTSGLVTLKVYDLLGREIATLVNETKSYGRYHITFDAGKISSGIYFYRLEVTPSNGEKEITIQKAMQVIK